MNEVEHMKRGNDKLQMYLRNQAINPGKAEEFDLLNDSFDTEKADGSDPLKNFQVGSLPLINPFRSASEANLKKKKKPKKTDEMM